MTLPDGVTTGGGRDVDVVRAVEEEPDETPGKVVFMSIIIMGTSTVHRIIKKKRKKIFNDPFCREMRKVGLCRLME